MNHDLYLRRCAWLHRADPRAKLIFVVLCMAALLVTHHVIPLALGLLATHLIALSTRIPPRHLLNAWRTLWSLTLIILALSSITWDAAAPALLQIGRFSITVPSILYAAGLALRIDALAFAFLLLLWTTEQGELIVGLTRLRLPFGASLTIAIAMQLVPTLGRIAGEILEAQQARGLQARLRNPMAAARAYLPALVPLLITALRMVDNLAMALEARAYRAGAPRSSRRVLRMHAGDWGILLAGLVSALVALWFRLG